MTGEQQPDNKEGQPLQATATAPQPEAKAPEDSVNWSGLQAAIKAEADKVHSTLRKEGAERDKYLRLAKHELGERDSKLSRLQEEMDSMIAKGEGGVDVAKKAKEIREREAQLIKKEQMQAWKDAELAEVASQLHSTKLNDLIEDLCTAKESDPDLRAKLIANVKKLNPKTEEDVEEYVGMLNVKPPVKTPPVGDMKGGGANKPVLKGSPIELARNYYNNKK